MTTAAEAANVFVTGPCVLQAARELLDNFPLPTLCEALANARREDAEPLTSALERLAQFEEVRESFLNVDAGMPAFLSQGAAAGDVKVRLMVAKLLVQLARGGETAVTSILEAGLFPLFEPLLLDEETGPAEEAARAVHTAVQCSAGHRAILGSTSDSLVGRLHTRLRELPDVQRIRILCLFVEMGRASEEVFSVLEERGAFGDVLGAFLTDDLLLKLNAVELMDALGSYPAGQAFLGRQGVPEKLACDLQDPCCDSSVRICVTRLLGLVLRRTPSVASSLLPSHEAPFPQSVARLLDSRDPAEKLCALNTWANASSGLEGLSFFIRWKPLMQEILSLVASTKNEISNGSVAAWATVLEERAPPNPPVAGTQASSPDAELWDMAESQLLPLVLKNLVSKPFPDVRPHTYRLLATLVRSQRAVQQAVPSAELRELLLDFSSESGTDAKIAKYQMVETMLREHSNWLSNFLDVQVYDLLETYVKQGPHWIPRMAATAVGDQAA
eukprot:TRINITY_DN24698_c0_g1_i1.p1 TRINITY_DN24698_c0_g1~~TRINITY_DN24698_c0_g1_i1.p1  ORF type:complete len:513 (+),score=82.04 TRINITY_DN24698_c0_g1_i1:38-1540(+)